MCITLSLHVPKDQVMRADRNEAVLPRLPFLSVNYINVNVFLQRQGGDVQGGETAGFMVSHGVN